MRGFFAKLFARFLARYLVINEKGLRNWREHMDTCTDDSSCMTCLAGSIFAMMGGVDRDSDKAVPIMAQLIDLAACRTESGDESSLALLEAKMRDFKSHKEYCYLKEGCLWDIIESIFQMIRDGAGWEDAFSNMVTILQTALCSYCAHPVTYSEIYYRPPGM